MALRDDQQKHIRDWQASNLSQAAYCRAHGLNAKTFGNWLRAHRRERNAIELPALIPVAVKPAAASTEVVSVQRSHLFFLSFE